MKKLFTALAISFVMIPFLSGSASALSLGTDITVSDRNNTGTAWYSDREDQEVEPGMVANQTWDLEGFFLNGTILSMVGGYDFINNTEYTSGDIFIDINGDAVFGDIDGSSDGFKSVSNIYGYDYVIDLDFSTFSYDLYSIDSGTLLTTSYYKQNQGSSPWRYESGGSLLSENISFTYGTGYSDADTGFLGGSHNLVTDIDMGFIAGSDFIAHFTMGCGNDNLMADGTVPTPEPASMILLGSGLIGMGGLVRRKKVGNN